MFYINDLQFIHSGGAANTDPFLDLGGIISSAAENRVKTQVATTPINVTGVTIDAAFSNTEGVGVLSWNVDTNFLSWKSYTSSVYHGATITGDGTYLLGDSAGYLEVDVVQASLAVSNRSDTITVANETQNMFDIVSSSKSLLGDIAHRAVYIKNTNATITATDVRIWISKQTPAGDYIELGLDPAGIGDGVTTGVMTTIATEADVPAGVSFTIPENYSNGLLIGDLDPNETVGFWVRRTVPVETRGTVISNNGVISIGAQN